MKNCFPNFAFQWVNLCCYIEVAAPTDVGVAAGTAASIVCPFDLKGTGQLSAAQETFIGNGTCIAWNLSSLTAGVTAHAAILAKDGCGYMHLPSATTAATAGGTLTYDDIVDASIAVTAGQAECPSTLPTRSPSPTPMSSAWYGADGYCGVNADVHVLRVTPTVAGVAKLMFNLGSTIKAFHSVDTNVGVDQGGIAAAATRIVGAGVDGAEAGVPIEFLVAPADTHGNPVAPINNPPNALLNVVFSDAGASVVSKTVKGANYAVTVIFPTSGPVKVTVTVSNKPAASMLVTVTPAPPRKIVLPGATNAVIPAARSMHAASAAGSDVFLFGGALGDRAYTNEMWRFHPGVAGNTLWRWRHSVTVTGIGSSAHAVISMTVDSGGAIAAGRMRADCADIRVVTPSGAEVAHFVEPAGAPSGCGSTSTLIWANATADAAGKASVNVLYGNTAATSISNPTSVFTVFEDFEGGNTGDSPSGWALDAGASVACGVAAPDATTFTISDDVALSGTKSLKVSGATKTGGGFKRDAAGMGNAFVLKAYLRDSACSGSFWISPDFTACDSAVGGGGDGDKSVLPANARAVGVHSCATPTHYAATYPWEASTAPRTGGWHSLAFYSGGVGGNTTAVVDDEAIARRTTGPMTMDRVFLWASKVPDAPFASDVYWDAIFAAPWSPAISTVVAAAEAVAWSPTMAWTKVGVTSPPSPRQGHSFTAVGAAGAEGELIAFGGERSGHYLGDVWRYTVTSDAWEFVPTRNSSAVIARAEHAAVVSGTTLVIFGGRGPNPKGDLWTLDLDAAGADASAGAWIQRSTPADLTPRFGHTAAVHDGKMYVVGGYVGGGVDTAGGLSSEVWSLDLTTYEWTFLGPRSTAVGAAAVGAAATGMYTTLQFPAPLPAARLSALGAAASATNTMYLIGGVGGVTGDVDMQDAWRLDLRNLTWSHVNSYSHQALTRADGSMVALGDGKTGFVFGGTSGGALLSDLTGGSYIVYME
jgi:hypothetical protein